MRYKARTATLTWGYRMLRKNLTAVWLCSLGLCTSVLVFHSIAEARPIQTAENEEEAYTAPPQHVPNLIPACVHGLWGGLDNCDRRYGDPTTNTACKQIACAAFTGCVQISQAVSDRTSDAIDTLLIYRATLKCILTVGPEGNPFDSIADAVDETGE